MDIVLALKTIVMGLVEGITEFLPISSTGHLILTGDLLNFLSAEKRAVFEVAIQLGAILAVCYEYRERLWLVVRGLPTQASAQRFALNVSIAFLPAALLGFLFINAINAYLFKPLIVAAAFVVGGFIILWIEKRPQKIRIHHIDELKWHDALKVGVAQCLALIPGTSRSGATIMSGIYFGLERKVATEFSFFLAIPVMFAATAYSILKHRHELTVADAPVFLLGGAVAFVSALLVIRALLRYVSQHDFTIFAWYRIAFGAVIVVTALTGTVSWTH